MQKNKHGFTLIELLVVVGVIAVLMAIAVPNFLGARDRANDLKRKAELAQLKNALRIYYNDYNVYPGESAPTYTSFLGCGAAGVSACSAGGSFSTGTSPNEIVYMKNIPNFTTNNWKYRTLNGGDNFCLWSTLTNGSDSEVVASRTKCSACFSLAGTLPSNTNPDFIMCAD